MAKRWLIGGLAVGVGALVVAPEARTWLRRRLGLEPEDRRWFEEEGAEAAEYEGDEPLDTREARFSLRARLSEDAPRRAAAAAPAAPSPSTAPEPRAGARAARRSCRPSPSARARARAAPSPRPTPEPERRARAARRRRRCRPAGPRRREPGAVEPESRSREPRARGRARRARAAEPGARSPRDGRSSPTSDAVLAARARLRRTASYEALPAIAPEADAPKTPGEDTDEVGPLPAASSLGDSAERAAPAADRAAPPRRAAAPSRPFSSESASFRSAIDAARERVHGAAREATPDEGESTELEERTATP